MDKAFYEFGEFRLDGTEHLLYRGGAVVPLKPKVVETLELLVREQGRLITKDELMTRLWPDTVVEESNLAQNIYLLRKVLGTRRQRSQLHRDDPQTRLSVPGPVKGFVRHRCFDGRTHETGEHAGGAGACL